MRSQSTDRHIEILLVEDNPGDARLIREMLTEAGNGFAMEHVDRLSAGLARLARGGIDLALLDLALPDSQGLDTFIKTQTAAPETPVILLTGFDDDALAVQAVKSGAQDYLVKGQFDSNLLERAIRYAIERQRLVATLKQRTDALFNSEARLHNMIEHNADGIIIVDDAGIVQFVNPAAERLFGRSTDEFLGQPFGFPLVTPNATELNIDRGSEPDVNIVAEMNTTETIWEGKTAYLVTLRDITQRKQMEETLRESKERFRRVATSITDHIYAYEVTADGQRSMQYLSPNIEEFTGYPFENFIVDWSFWPRVVIHPDDQEIAAEQAERLARGQDSRMEYRLAKADGEVIWVRDSARVEITPNANITYGVVSDITQQKQAQTEIMRLYTETHQRAQQLAVMHELDRAISSSLHIDDIYHAFSEFTSLLLSYDRMSVVLLERDKLHISYVAGLANPPLGAELPLEDTITGWVITHKKPALINDVATNTKFGGKARWASGVRSVMVLPIQIKRQAIGTWNIGSQQSNAYTSDDLQIAELLTNQLALGIENARLFQQAQQEIVERKQAQELLEAERASLAQRVEERTTELRVANAELARTARLKDEFLANMSHELRTPLNAIIGMSEVLRSKVYGPLTEEQLGAISHIEDGGRHLLELVNDILDLSKIEAAKLELAVGLIQVNDVCQASLLFVKQLAQQKRIKVLFTFDNSVETLYADQRRLKQILVNLLNNAVKFTPEGGQVGLEVKDDPMLQVVHFIVWDTGIGISPEDMNRLFEPFVQLDSRLNRRHEGTGLGLSMVSRLAEMHNGRVSVESKVGTGSRFTVSLPWQIEGKAAEEQESREVEERSGLLPGTPTPNHPCTILLAEDNETNIIVMRDILQAKGHRVIVTRNGLEAIEQARQTRPDVILMDIQMPGLDGLEATRRIRADAELAAIPIIALTALAMPGDRERCLTAGANEYLSKPIDSQELVEAIETQLQRG